MYIPSGVAGTNDREGFQMKQKLLLLAAVFFGVMAFMLTFQQINQEKRKIQAATTEVAVLVVTKDIAENEPITEDAIQGKKIKMYASQISASRDIPYSSKNMIINRRAQLPIEKGKILQWNDLQNSVSVGRDGVTRLIQPGYRAVSIAVDQTASVSGLVQPNNYVDLIGTFKFPDMRGDASMDTITLTILQRVRVIATGTDYGLQSGRGQGARSYGTITLELSPKEVEMIIFATQKGRIQMSLRNYEDAAVARDLQSVNWKYLQENVSKYMKERENSASRSRY